MKRALLAGVFSVAVGPAFADYSGPPTSSDRLLMNVGNFSTPQDYGCAENGVADCAQAANIAAQILDINGRAVNVYMRGGLYDFIDHISMQPGQCIYGDGVSRTVVEIGYNFSTSATGVFTPPTSSDGSGYSSNCIHDLAVQFLQPYGNTATLTGAAISGTSLTATIASGVPANGNALNGTGVSGPNSATPTAPTILSAVSIVGSALTATVSISQSVGSEAMTTAVARGNVATLASGCSANTVCEYPPAIFNQSGASGRLHVWNVNIGGAWNGIDDERASGLQYDNINIASVNVGLTLNNAFDFGYVDHYEHHAAFGLCGLGQPITCPLYQNVYEDGNVFGAKLEAIQGLHLEDFRMWQSRIALTSTFQWSTLIDPQMDGNNSTIEVAATVAGLGLSIVGGYATGAAYGANTHCQLDVAAGNIITTVTSFRFDVSNNTNAAGGPCVAGGNVNIQGGYITSHASNVVAVKETGGNLNITGTQINTASTPAYTVSPITVSGGALTLSGTSWTQAPTSGSVTPVSLSDATTNAVVANNFGGWSFSAPGTAGSYANNFGSGGIVALSQLTLTGANNALVFLDRTGTGSGWDMDGAGGNFHIFDASAPTPRNAATVTPGISGTWNFTETTVSTSPTTGAVTTPGGVGIGLGLFVGGLAGTGSRVLCATATGGLEAGTLAAGLVTCP